MYRLADLLSDVDGARASLNIENVTVTGVCSDSRSVCPGQVFVCIKGKNNDGSEYIKEAIKRGAIAIVCEGNSSAQCDSVIYVTVTNARSACARMLSRVYGDPCSKMKIIAVTGTNGKTTVTKMIENALKESGKRCAVIGTLGASFENETVSIATMTTPDPDILYALLAKYADAGAQYVVMEASSHALALSKLDGMSVEIAAITNLTAEHLDFHGNMENYYAAKASLFDKCKTGVFLCDDYYTVKMYNESKCNKVSCSVKDARWDYHAENVGYSFENGTIFTVAHKGEAFPVHSSVAAEFTVSNALLAATVLRELGVEAAAIYKGIASLRGVEGRMQRLETQTDFSVYIDFAHTPDALAKLLESVRKIKKREERIVTLFGCGGDRDRTKRALMGAVASHLSDFVIITEDNSRSEEPSAIIDEIMSGFDKSCPHVRIDDREKAIEFAILNAEKNDIILLCGKGHEKYEIGKNGARPFCESDIVKTALKKRKERKGDY